MLPVSVDCPFLNTPSVFSYKNVDIEFTKSSILKQVSKLSYFVLIPSNKKEYITFIDYNRR
jgi:hypothetical protein